MKKMAESRNPSFFDNGGEECLRRFYQSRECALRIVFDTESGIYLHCLAFTQSKPVKAHAPPRVYWHCSAYDKEITVATVPKYKANTVTPLKIPSHRNFLSRHHPTENFKTPLENLTHCKRGERCV
ncbi:hypothetical protein E3N88_34426 [Mikania micrantha]|uniref:Uncharacterized protein n=1 Tax=Mikania micrantha TaxID=192012 RepID=A0A5N6LYZ5_9ASTR|nr:hypothetical protein E3N88_34426 [Mikania micrantha]